jgi:O-antigen/teichoic acid export membrane protein
MKPRWASISSLTRRSLAVASSDSLYRNSTFLVANAATSALFGFLFWAIAARLLTPQAVGLATAIVTAAALVASFSYLGFDSALIKYLPSSATRDHDTHAGLTLTGLASLVGSAIALTLAAESGSGLKLLISSPLTAAAFATMCLLSCWNAITNSVFIAERMAQYVFLTTLAFCLVRFPFLFLLRHDGYTDATTAWLVGLVANLAASFLILAKRSGYRYKPSLDVHVARRMVGFASANYVSSVAGTLPQLLFPSVILSVIGADYAGYFYVVYLIVTCVYQVPYAVGQSLLAEGSKDRGDMWPHVRKAAMAASLPMIPALVLLIAIGYPLLTLFGHEYARHAYSCLVVLCITGVPKVGSAICGTILRIANRMKTLVFGTVVGAVVASVGGVAGLVHFRTLIAVAVGMLAGELVVFSVFLAGALRLRRSGQPSVPGSNVQPA